MVSGDSVDDARADYKRTKVLMRSFLLYETLLQRNESEFKAAGDAELVVERGELVLYGLLGHPEAARHLAIGAAVENGDDDLALAAGQVNRQGDGS